MSVHDSHMKAALKRPNLLHSVDNTNFEECRGHRQSSHEADLSCVVEECIGSS